MASEKFCKKLRAAVVYPYFAHYREPIMRALCREKDPVYTMVSGKRSDNPSIKQITYSNATRPPEEGGLRWLFVGNWWLRGPLLWQRGLLRLVWSREFDTIIFLGNPYFLSTWIGAVLARLCGKRVLMWSHGFVRREKGLKGWIRTRLYKLAHGMLLYGNWARNILIDKGFDPQTLYVVFNSLDYDKQFAMRKTITDRLRREKREALFANPDWPMIFFVGRLTPRKKLTMLLEAAAKLREQGRDVNVLLIGDGPARAELEAQVQKHDLSDRVVFYGACHSENELAPLISAADVCVSPGEVGLTAMHSMVYGTPVITHNNPEKQGPEFEAIVDSKSGMFYPEGSVAGLSETIGDWLELAQSRSREEIRRDCQEVIDDYYNPHVQIETLNAAVAGSKTAEELPLGESQYVRRLSKREAVS